MKLTLHCLGKPMAVCILLLLFNSTILLAQRNPLLAAGNSYINITKRVSGGFVQTGDTLEIRTNYYFGSGYNSNNIYRVRYYDSIPLKTAICTGGSNDYLRLITNEGVVMRSYSYAGTDDAGTYTAAPGTGNYQVRINIGATVSAPAAVAGTLSDITGASTVAIGTYRPRLFGGTLITTAFRVRVTGNAGDTIVLAAARLAYKKTSSGADTVITLSPFKILISSAAAPTLCNNSLGNNLSSEYAGTFDSGTVRNRAAAPTYLIPSYDYLNNVSGTVSVYDGSYAIINNTSPLGSTAVNARFQPYCSTAPAVPVTDSCRNRMHGGFWEIMGDHTGTNNAVGNAPARPGNRGGYMLMVNANVVTTEAYRQLVTGLCPDTYYEFSAWVKNICKRCAIDSNSVNTYRPGVYPNLSFSINGLDMYSTGFLDTTGWQKKGFIFKTGPGQTAALLSIRNNASGGGGNDWVLDDLSIGTCGPVMRLNYMPVFLGCGLGTLVNLSDTIKYSFNPTYSWYKWERSTDGGLTWTDPPTPAFGQATPVLVGGFYQYVTNYPPFVAFTADSGHRYRVVVANSLANLSNPSCYFTDGNHTFLRIINCGTVLPTNFISFTGTLTASNKVSLQWLVNGEKDIVQYAVEYSADGSRFTTAGNIKAQQNPLQAMYDYTDAGNALLPAYYRIKMMNAAGLYRYSKTILLSNKYSFSVQGVPNPFTNSIGADIILPKDGLVKMWLMDSHGKTVATAQVKMYRGLNKFVSQPLAHLSSGIYVALWEFDGLQVQRKLTKSQ